MSWDSQNKKNKKDLSKQWPSNPRKKLTVEARHRVAKPK